LTFKQIAEPESHVHPDRNNDMLWENVPRDHTWLWNGLRGGIIVPATSMEISGLSQDAYLSNWAAKGAEKNKIKSDSYFAYDLQGYYRFSESPNDEKLMNELRREVKFLVEDAPALKGSINPNAPVEITDLTMGFISSKNGQAKTMQPLVNCGRNLILTPVILIDFGEGKGRLILSQLVTKGRLTNSRQTGGLYDIRYDAVACQFIINMIKTVRRSPYPQ
jgi:beta-galactosidase